MSIINVGDFVKIAEGALALWKYGFSQSACSATQYSDFGTAIQALGANIKLLERIVELQAKKSARHLPQCGLDSVKKICGDFGKTIEECHQLLYDHRKFSDKHDSGVLRNIQWNLTIEPEVKRLHERVMFHNVKITTMLKPFEVSLMTDVDDRMRQLQRGQVELTNRVDEGFNDVLLASQGIFTENALEAKRQATAPPPVLPPVPEDLEVKFAHATDARRRDQDQEPLEHGTFPFYSGINAFHRHFNDSTVLFKPNELATAGQEIERTAPPRQYLNLLKSAWVLKRMREGEEWASESSEKLPRCFMKELEVRCASEYSRFTTSDARQKLTEPDPRSMMLLDLAEFRIWLDEDEDEDTFQYPDDFQDEILRVPLKSETKNRKQELVVIRKVDGELQLQQLTSIRGGTPNVKQDPVILSKAQLMPLYANPSSTQQAHNVMFKYDERIQQDQALSFQKFQDMLDFQCAITAYKVVFYSSGIETQMFQPKNCFSNKKKNAAGRIQIWFPKRLEPSAQRPQMASINPPRGSVTTRGSTALSVAKTFTTACSLPIEGSNESDEEVVAFQFEVPRHSMVVLLLKEENSSKPEAMSLITILMDPKTVLEHQCGCNREVCKHSYIKRPKGLLVRVLPARGDGQVNIAAIGRYQAPKEKEAEYERNVKWLRVNFPKPSSARDFEEEFERTKRIYCRQLSDYISEKNREKLE